MDNKFRVFDKWLLDNGSKFPKLGLKVRGHPTLTNA